MSKYAAQYARDPNSKESYIFEATYYSSHCPGVQIDNTFIALFPEEVVNYLENDLQAFVLSVRCVGAANLIL